MTLQTAHQVSVQKAQREKLQSFSGVGVVYNVILDENDTTIQTRGLNVGYVGAIEFKFSDKQATSDTELPIAYPIDKNFKTLPLKNEVVEIIQSDTGAYYYRRIGADITPNTNSSYTTISDSTTESGDKQSTNYSNIAKTGISRSTTNTSNKYDGYGRYFTAQQDIHKLRLYEGDTVVESRFGQSLRMSGYNNADNVYSPITILRNGENTNSKNQPNNISIDEDVNSDGSIIAMTSGEVVSNFNTAILTDSDTFKEPLKNLKGAHQMLLNSDRIILSAKTGEMMFFSKGDYGFRSEGTMLLHNLGGIRANVGADVVVLTNDNNFNIDSGGGHINLGNSDESKLEPLVMGDTLEKLLNDLLTAINNQVFRTPAGKTATGPENKSDFNTIKDRLNQIKSTLNKTS